MFELIWNLELRVNTKFVLGLPSAKHVDLEHGKIYLRACDQQPADPEPIFLTMEIYA